MERVLRHLSEYRHMTVWLEYNLNELLNELNSLLPNENFYIKRGNGRVSLWSKRGKCSSSEDSILQLCRFLEGMVLGIELAQIGHGNC